MEGDSLTACKQKFGHNIVLVLVIAILMYPVPLSDESPPMRISDFEVSERGGARRW